jgi:hypothetical protein
MSKFYYLKQCELKREVDHGTVVQVAWIPDKFAIKGKKLGIKNAESIWEEGWVVNKVFEHRINVDDLLLLQNEYRYTRAVSDV